MRPVSALSFVQWDAAALAQQAAANVAVANPNDASRINKDAIAKAQRMAAIQAQIQQQMQNLQSVPGAGNLLGSAGPAAALGMPGIAAPGLPGVPKTTFMPAPLILDEKGRHVDSSGKEVVQKAEAVATLKANQRELRAIPLIEPEQAKSKVVHGDLVDPRMSMDTGRRQKRATFTFVEDQRYIKRAERFRNKMRIQEFNEQLRKIRQDKGEKAEKESLIQINLELLKQKQEPVPDVEWWDARMLVDAKSYGGEQGAPVGAEDKITIYVEHPVPIEPPAEAPEPPPLPMFLTKKERKKLRRRTRMERELQRQEMVARGFIPPPEPKVKISNMMRVLSADATADPTKIEQEVKKQMEQRLKNHNDRNAARKKTVEEKRAKKLEKIAKETEVETTVHLYKIGDLQSKQNRYKIDVNAQYYKLHGIGIISDDCSLLCLEGGLKSLNKIKKLLQRRIKWNKSADDEEGEEDEMESDNEEAKGGKNNFCKFVWEGKIQKAAFPEFKFEVARSEGNARDLLRRRNCEHYWDLVKNHDE
jgi:U4/U6 small nuclear ribonucleoprotein PRP3